MLAGEPVWMFEYKYNLNKVHIQTDADLLEIQMTTDPIPELFTNGVAQLDVPESLFRLIRLSSEFDFKLEHRDPLGMDGNFVIQRHNPGLLDGQGQWGWDVPGSPDWGKVFILDLYPGVMWNDLRYLSPDNAKAQWTNMCEKGPTFWNRLEISDLKLDLSDFLAELKKVNPGAAKFVDDLAWKKTTIAAPVLQVDPTTKLNPLERASRGLAMNPLEVAVVRGSAPDSGLNPLERAVAGHGNSTENPLEHAARVEQESLIGQALRAAAQNVVKSFEEGKPLPYDLRAAATQAVEQARNGNQQMKEMAQRLAVALQISITPP
jgi:hypothetical protein